MPTAELQAGPTTAPSREPTNDELVMALLRLDGDIHKLLAARNLSPDRFLAFVNDPKVQEVLAAFDVLNERRWRQVARKQQETAAVHLTKALEDSPSPVETRRAATALARLAANMLKSPAPHPTLRSKLAALTDEFAHSEPEPRPATPPAPPPASTRPTPPAHPAPPSIAPRTPALPAA